MNNPNNIALTAADLYKLISWGPCRIRRIFGTNNQSTDRYIQLHEAPFGIISNAGGTAIAASTVPANKSFIAQANFVFDIADARGIDLSELVLGISTTAVNYTAPSANQGLDLTIEVDTIYPYTGVETWVNTGQAASNSGTIWANGSFTSQRLLRLVTVPQDTAALWAVVSSTAAHATDLQYAMQVPANTSGIPFDPGFGRQGIRPYSLNYSSGSRVEENGCYVTYYNNLTAKGSPSASPLWSALYATT